MRQFTIEVKLDDGQSDGAVAGSKRNAEQAAAKALLEKLEAHDKAGFVTDCEPNAGEINTIEPNGRGEGFNRSRISKQRARIRGVAIEGDAQIVFVDTPGLFKPRRLTAQWSPPRGAGPRSGCYRFID